MARMGASLLVLERQPCSQDNHLRKPDPEGLSITGCTILDKLLDSPSPSFSTLIYKM